MLLSKFFPLLVPPRRFSLSLPVIPFQACRERKRRKLPSQKKKKTVENWRLTTRGKEVKKKRGRVKGYDAIFSPLFSTLFSGGRKKILARMGKKKQRCYGCVVWFFPPSIPFSEACSAAVRRDVFNVQFQRERRRETTCNIMTRREWFSRVALASRREERGREGKEEGQTSHKTRGGDNFSSRRSNTLFFRERCGKMVV